MISSKEARRIFLDFFSSKLHTVEPSAPIISKNDASLLFINAGMNQFKAFFIGTQNPENYRVTNTQKCLRVSGKHNDLEEVGRDTYHHTMFEMMGNWSFGDYFKKEAVEWAWELLIKVYKIDKNRLYVTVFKGDDGDNLPKDTETYKYWTNYFPESRILECSKKNNFWEMGKQGPCGPSSEIHIDLRPESEVLKEPGSTLVNKDHPLVIELWNLVFMEFNRKSDGTLEKLPKKHVDTGMGFERLCMVLQGKTSNYDTDVFHPIIIEIETITGFLYGKDKNVDIAIRVIADHIRAISFAIADGQLPSNNGSGYVIRRILRRAIRYSYTFLDLQKPFIFRLVYTLVNQLKDVFPELKKQKNLISNVIKEEEISFLRTLGQGLKLLDTVIESTTSKTVDGKKVFELYDTYGFPVDLTELILKEKGYSVDKKQFEVKLNKQKERSKAADKSFITDWQVLKAQSSQEFLGYDSLQSKVQISRYCKVIMPKQGDIYKLVFDKTPFYAEGGGQVGDKGYLETSNGDVIYIIDTKKENNLSVHLTKSLPKKLDDVFTAVVDRRQRTLSSGNHTTTHLLHQALRSILGNHVEQKGSMVHSAYLRFDFSHFSKLTPQELQQVESFVNARIREQINIEEHRDLPFQEALKGNAIAMFGEKYGDKVRTIKFGNSYELCGGTHVKNTADIWHFIITSETAVATGVRRIEAITSEAAKDYFISQSLAYNKIKSILKTNEPIKAIERLKDDVSSQKKLIQKLRNEKKETIYHKLKSKLKEINGIRFLTEKINLDTSSIKDLCFRLGNEYDNLVLLLACVEKQKIVLNCFISKSLAKGKGLDASVIISKINPYVKGRGGGQSFFATSCGTNPEGLTKAFEVVQTLL